VLDLELLQVVRPVGQGDAPVHDASGPLGAGAVLKVVEAKGEGWRTPTARSDVTYSATARFTPDAWAWPGDEDATTLVGGCSAEILDDAPRESRGTWNPAACGCRRVEDGSFSLRFLPRRRRDGPSEKSARKGGGAAAVPRTNPRGRRRRRDGSSAGPVSARTL